MTPLLPPQLFTAIAAPVPSHQNIHRVHTPAQRPGLPAWAPPRRRGWLLGVLALHGVLVWALLQTRVVQQAVQAATPLMVSIINAAPLAAQPAPDMPGPPPPRKVVMPPLAAVAIPAVRMDPVPERLSPTAAPAAPAATAAPAAPTIAAAPPTEPAPLLLATAPAAAAAAASQPPAPAPPGPKTVPAGALRYTVPPPTEVPMASRRLQEAGTVWLRVLFDTSGRPRQVAVYKSSGFARLDEQAQQAMRQARIAPYLDNGIAVEVVATAPLAYELD